MNILKKFLLSTILLATSYAYAWTPIAPNTYAVYGTQILESNTGSFEPVAELVYNSEYRTFGVSFISTDGSRNTIPYGIFRIKRCGVDTIGAIAGHILRDPASVDQLRGLLSTCDRSAYLRVWDTSNNYSLYKFDDVGPIVEK